MNEGRRLDNWDEKLAFLERRLTLLEHAVARLSGAPAPAFAATTPIAVLPTAPPRNRTLECDDPGLIIHNGYKAERDPRGQKYVWVGAPGPIQMILPVAPVPSLICRLHIWTHPRIDFSALQLQVNDRPCAFDFTESETHIWRLSFGGMASGAANIHLVMRGVSSFRPVDAGESADVRWLAFQLFGVDLIYDDASLTDIG